MCVISIVHDIRYGRLFRRLFIIFFSCWCVRERERGKEKILYLRVSRLSLSLAISSFLRVKRSRRRIVSERRASIAERGENLRVRYYLIYCYSCSSKNAKEKQNQRRRIRKQIYFANNLVQHGSSTSFFNQSSNSFIHIDSLTRYVDWN